MGGRQCETLLVQGVDLEAMGAIAQASNERSLQKFEQALDDYNKQLREDPFINSHLAALYDNLLQENLCRIIEPYSRVEVEHIAKLIDLPHAQVHKKLSQMILDHKFRGILDQGAGCLVVFDEPTKEVQLDILFAYCQAWRVLGDLPACAGNHQEHGRGALYTIALSMI